jgi:hypothetical protein
MMDIRNYAGAIEDWQEMAEEEVRTGGANVLEPKRRAYKHPLERETS